MSRFCSSHARLAGTIVWLPAGLLTGTPHVRVSHFEILARAACTSPACPVGRAGSRGWGLQAQAQEPYPQVESGIRTRRTKHIVGCLRAIACVLICWSPTTHFMSTYCRVVWTADRAFLYQSICSPPSSLHPKKKTIYNLNIFFINVSKI
jgi:hypothetical protein